MFHGPSPHARHHNTRFYIVAVTVIVAAIFLFLFLDKGGDISGAAIVGDFSGDNVEELEKEAVAEEVALENMEKDFSLTFDKVPKINTEAKIETLTLTFNDPSTIININEDRLELSNLEEINLDIEGFLGEISLNEVSLSLDGTAKRIEVNNVALSSKEELEISFQNLKYNGLNINDVRLSELKFPVGKGVLKVAERLTYILENENVGLNYFRGNLVLGKNTNTTSGLEGTVKGLSVNGEAFSLALK